MRKNQKGFTLVELIIAVAILAIVTAAVCGFIVVGSRSYASSNTDIMLQQEAQLALNQISDVIIDTTDSISYGVRADGSGDMQMVLKDSEFGGEATEKCLIVVNRDEADSNNHNPSYWFYWSKEQEKIYFNEVDASSSTMDQDQIEEKFKDAEMNKAILAQHVTDFSIDISQFEANRVVMISVTFENGNRTYSTSNNVTVRNRIALNEITVGPMKRAEDFEINVVKNITMEPGETIDLLSSNIVEVVTSGDKALTWELIGSPTSSTLSDGVLSVGIGETSQNYNIKVSRANEQYEGQNERVAQTVKVNIKRATSVDFTGPSTAKKGDTIELSARAGDRNGLLGNKLCDGHGQIEATLASDKDVDNWTVVSGDAQIVSQGDGKATIKILDNATAGSKIVIRADSALSWNRTYGMLETPTVPPVWSEYVITVEKSQESSAIPKSNGFLVGTDNPDNGRPMVLNYLLDGLKYSTYDYIIYARVKDPVGGQDDRVIIYRCDGQNIRFFPDMFGLYWNRSYELYLQAIIPVPADYMEANKASNGSDFSGYAKDHYDEVNKKVVAELLDHNNLDDSGKYIGTKFYAGEYYADSLDPPAFTLTVNGSTYPSDNPYQHEKYSVLNGGDRGMGSIGIGSSYNVSPNTIREKDMRKYSIYKEAENDSWTWLAGYKITDGQDVGSYVSGTTFKFSNDMFEAGVGSDPFIKRDINKKDFNDMQEACGNYRIVVGYEYKNDPNAGKSVQYDFLYAGNDIGGTFTGAGTYPVSEWDYSMHYYESSDCFIPWTVEMFNLQLPSNGGNELWSSFPVPGDTDFPFTGDTSLIQTKYWGTFEAYTKSGNRMSQYDLSNVKVDCQYLSDGYYEIWLYTESGRDGASYQRNIIGIYKCKMGETEWTPINLNPSSDAITNRTNIEYTKDKGLWAAYFPYPGDSDFPFAGITEKTTKSYSYIAYNKNSNYDTMYETVDVICTHENGVYTIEFVKIVPDAGNKHKQTRYSYNKWQCSANGSYWQPIGKYEEETQAVWDSLIYFKANNGEKKAEFPLPGEAGFPSFANDEFTREETIYYYGADDQYGEQSWNQGSITVTVTYIKNNDGTYTITLRSEEPHGWDSTKKVVTLYGKWTSTPEGWRNDQTTTSWEERMWDTLVYFSYEGKDYKMELPLPGSAKFPDFEGSTTVYSVSAYYSDDEQGSNSPWLPLYLEYTESGGTYTVVLMYSQPWPGGEVTAWTCASNGTSWTKIR